MNQEPCRWCSTIHDNEDEARKVDPLCQAAHLVRHGEHIMFYVPCKDDFYDSTFVINYCPMCGRKLD